MQCVCARHKDGHEPEQPTTKSSFIGICEHFLCLVLYREKKKIYSMLTGAATVVTVARVSVQQLHSINVECQSKMGGVWQKRVTEAI